MNTHTGHSGPELLIAPEHRLITLTGAGGKTSLSRWLASHLQLIPRRVIITTTTKILPLPGMTTILHDDGPDFLGRIRRALDQSPSIMVASRFDPATGKIIGLDKNIITFMHKSRLADTILVEADGAARKPLKAPNWHEPVIPAGTDLCIGIMGLDAAYRPLTESNVHRHEIFSQITSLKPGEKITPAHMTRIAMAPNGLFKGCPPDCELSVFLNKTDIPEGNELTEKFNSTVTSNGQASFIKWFAGSTQERRMIQIGQYTQASRIFSSTSLAFSHQL